MRQPETPRAFAERVIAAHTEEIVSERLCPEPVVSVVCQTYNHESFLAQAIESILAQETRFPFEILIGEDHSKDSTFEIARQFQQEHPDQVRLFRSTKNLCQIAGTPRLNTIRNLWNCRGKYIALVEGDDYWTDPHKLQKQVDYLEAHSKAAGCFTDCLIVDDDGIEIEPRPFWSKSYQRSYDQRSCLKDLKSAYATATLMFRSSVLDKGLPDCFLKVGSDFILDLIVSEHGTLDYLPGVTCAYRLHGGGSWQGSTQDQNLQTMIERMEALWSDSRFGRRYSVDLCSLGGSFFERLCKALLEEVNSEEACRPFAYSFNVPEGVDQMRSSRRLLAGVLAIHEAVGEEFRIGVTNPSTSMTFWLDRTKEAGVSFVHQLDDHSVSGVEEGSAEASGWPGMDVLSLMLLRLADSVSRWNEEMLAQNKQAEVRANRAETRAQTAQKVATDLKDYAEECDRRAREAEIRALQDEGRAAQAEGRADHAEGRADHAEARLRALTQSRSWRLTEPLRAVGRRLKHWRRGAE